MCHPFLQEPGGAASHAEEDKTKQYAHLDRMYQFHPVVVETCGTMGPKSRDFLRELGKCLRMVVTGEPRSYAFFLLPFKLGMQHQYSHHSLSM